MRNITVKRISSTVGKLGKVKIYIEDADNPEIKINKIPCRLLDTLKDGEEKIFEIPNEEVKIFAVTNKCTKGLNNDYMVIAPGVEDLSITGSVQFDHLMHTSFYFDGDVGCETLTNRSKNLKYSILLRVCFSILCLALALGFGLGFGLTSNQEKTFVKKGMSITLTEDFHEQSIANCFASYFSQEVGVIVFNQFSFNPYSYTAEDFAELVLRSQNQYRVPIQKLDKLTYCEWTEVNAVQRKKFSYFGVAFKSGNQFWFFQFGTATKKYENYRDQFIKWAKSIEL